jgi:hypothetical protein
MSGHHSTIKKFPFLLGWLVFYLSTLLLMSLLGLWGFPSLGNLFPQLTLSVNFISLMVQYVVIGFFAFTFSISKIALPLYRIGKLHADERIQVAFMAYPLRWILFLIYSVFYFSIPLLVKDLLPIKIEGPLYLAWSILASFLAYREVAHSWAKDIVLRDPKSNEDQVVTI